MSIKGRPTHIKNDTEVISFPPQPEPRKTSKKLQDKSVAKQIPQESLDEADVISKESYDDIQSLKLRLPRELLKDIDALVNQRKPKISRHLWILEKLYAGVKQDSVAN